MLQHFKRNLHLDVKRPNSKFLRERIWPTPQTVTAQRNWPQEPVNSHLKKCQKVRGAQNNHSQIEVRFIPPIKVYDRKLDIPEIDAVFFLQNTWPHRLVVEPAVRKRQNIRLTVHLLIELETDCKNSWRYSTSQQQKLLNKAHDLKT